MKNKLETLKQTAEFLAKTTQIAYAVYNKARREMAKQAKIVDDAYAEYEKVAKISDDAIAAYKYVCKIADRDMLRKKTVPIDPPLRKEPPS